MPQLDVSTFSSQLFWLGICFLALYGILSTVALPKITHLFETREEALEKKINKASLYREQAENLLADYDKALSQARLEAQERYRTLSRSIEIEITHKQKEFLNGFNYRLHQAEQGLYRAHLETRTEIKTVSADIAGMILKKLTGRSYSSEELLPHRKEV